MQRRPNASNGQAPDRGGFPRLTAVDLFAGAGGFSLGMRRAGFEVVLANEFSVDPEWTYRHNLLFETEAAKLPARPTEATVASRKAYRADGRQQIRKERRELSTNFSRQMRGGDIRRVLSDKWLRQWQDQQAREIDLVVAGPPCQGFSSAGNLRDDERNELVHEAIRVIRRLTPRVVIIENVPGMLERHEAVIEEIGLALGRPYKPNPGYYVVAELLHGEPVGVPQTRRRLLIVGVRRDLVNAEAYDRLPHLVFPVACPRSRPEDARLMGEKVASGSWLTANQILGDLASDPPAYGTGSWTSQYRSNGLEDATADFLSEVRSLAAQYLRGHGAEPANLPEGQEYFNHEASSHLPRVARRLELLRKAASSSAEARNHRCSSAWLRRQYKAEHPELVTKKSSQRVLLPDEWPMLTVTSLPDDIVHHSENRILTVREVARLQTFPDWFEFKGVRTTGAERRRAGIYVPQYSQVANAVPPRLAHAVAARIRQFLLLMEEDPTCSFEPDGGLYRSPNVKGTAHTRLESLADRFRGAAGVERG